MPRTAVGPRSTTHRAAKPSEPRMHVSESSSRRRILSSPRIAGLCRLPTRWSDDAPNKIVYYPDTTCGPAGQRVSGNELLVKNNDVWFRRTVDACSGEGLQTVNGSATV
jgi:hypothetical protein